MNEVAIIPQSPVQDWKLPSRGVVGMACLILAEVAVFLIFVVVMALRASTCEFSKALIVIISYSGFSLA